MVSAFNLSALNGLFSTGEGGRYLGGAHRTEGGPVPTVVG